VGEHACPHCPQSATLVASAAHTPLPFVCPGGQMEVQVPFTPTCPDPQAWLQAPQFVTVLLVSTHVRAQWVKPDGQADVH